MILEFILISIVIAAVCLLLGAFVIFSNSVLGRILLWLSGSLCCVSLAVMVFAFFAT